MVQLLTMLYFYSAWDSRLRSRMMRTTTTSCTMLLSILYEKMRKAQLQHFKTVAHGKFEAPIYKTSERKGVLSTSHLVQIGTTPVFATWPSSNRDKKLRYSATILLRRSLLQLHHVPCDSPLLQWCPQKLGCIHMTSTAHQYIHLFTIFTTHSSLHGRVCPRLRLWMHCECIVNTLWTHCEYIVNTLWILNLSLVLPCGLTFLGEEFWTKRGVALISQTDD